MHHFPSILCLCSYLDWTLFCKRSLIDYHFPWFVENSLMFTKSIVSDCIQCIYSNHAALIAIPGNLSKILFLLSYRNIFLISCYILVVNIRTFCLYIIFSSFSWFWLAVRIHKGNLRTSKYICINFSCISKCTCILVIFNYFLFKSLSSGFIYEFL